MAKKSKTESVLSKEVRKQAEADAISTAKAEAAKLAEAAEAVRQHAMAPVATAVRPKKVKKARYVRETTENKTQAKAAPLPPRSTKASSKLMTKNVHERPRKERGSGVESKDSKR
jgi:hypothetical protein